MMKQTLEHKQRAAETYCGVLGVRALLNRAAELRESDPESAAVKLRIVAEGLTTHLCAEQDPLALPDRGLDARIQWLKKRSLIDSRQSSALHKLQHVGNSGAHCRPVEPDEVNIEAAIELVRTLADPKIASAAPDALETVAEQMPTFACNDPEGIYLLRTARDTYIVRVEHDHAQLVLEGTGRLLFGHGSSLWAWDRYQEHSPFIPVDLEEWQRRWESLDDQTWPVSWVPHWSNRLMNLRTGLEYPAPKPSRRDRPDYQPAPDELWLREDRTLFGSVGPFVLWRTTSEYHTGAFHHNWRCEFTAFDLRSASEVTFLREIGDLLKSRADLLNEAKAALALDSILTEVSETETETGLADGKLPPELAAMIDEHAFDELLESMKHEPPTGNPPFSLDSNGVELNLTLISMQLEQNDLRLDCQLTAEACFAESDGRWDAYTRSTTVRLNELPDLLKPWAQAPQVVTHLRNVLSLPIIGWSMVDLSLQPHLEVQLDPGWMR